MFVAERAEVEPQYEQKEPIKLNTIDEIKDIRNPKGVEILTNF